MNNNCFHEIKFYKQSNSDYKLLPFNFKRVANTKVLLTNINGEFITIDRDVFNLFTQHKLDQNHPIYIKLKTRNFLSDENGTNLNLLASKVWTKKSIIQGFTKLHIFILTLRCNCSCTYCQASRQNIDASNSYDMDIPTARRAVEVMMQSPSNDITVEFQGGEPLLNFSVLKDVVLYSKELNQSYNKKLTFVVCTNLSILPDSYLDFFAEEKINISTSVDGPAALHDLNRCRSIKTARHSVVEKNLQRARQVLGRDHISALMTTTRQSLGYANEIIDEYLRLDLGSIFIRALNPYGFAIRTQKSIGYTEEEFVAFYKQVFNKIVAVNRQGITFPEAFATLLLRKILTPWPVGFVDLQSPTGNGFAVTVYNYDGDVYASDESRMLFEMGDAKFRLGNIFSDSYKDIYLGSTMQEIAANGLAESLAGCSQCPYVPYCGADPIRHYATQRDTYGHRPTSSFCTKNRLLFDFIFNELTTADSQKEEIFWAWMRSCSIQEVKLHTEKEDFNNA